MEDKEKKEDSFFDTNVIINYAYHYPGTKNIIIKKCHEYINDKIRNKIAGFIICYFVEKEITDFIKNRMLIHSEVLKKIRDRDHSLENSKYLIRRYIPYAKKLYIAHKNFPIEKVSKIFSQERKELSIKIDRFYKTRLDHIVVPIEEIDTQLVNTIHNTIQNHADCKVIASALQYEKSREKDKTDNSDESNESNEFIIVTADKKDLDPNTYDFLKDDLKLKDYNFPELLNLAYES